MSENSVGRPKEENPRNVQLKIKVTEEEARRIEELAEKMGMNKSRLIRNLLLGGLDDGEFLQKIYVLPIAKKIFEWSDKVRGI